MRFTVQLGIAYVVSCIVVSSASGDTWTRGGPTASISVDGRFSYNLTMSNSSGCDLSGGILVFHCAGKIYDTASGVLSMSGAPVSSSGTDPRLGPYDAISAIWAPKALDLNADCTVSASISYFAGIDAFIFNANFSSEGVPGANAMPLLKNTHNGRGGGPDKNANLSTAFPSWPVNEAATSCSHFSYQGNSLGANFRAGELSTWQGGLEGGPLLLYPTPPAGSTELPLHPPAVVLSALTHAKAMMGSPLPLPTDSLTVASNSISSGRRVAFGVQGYVEVLPPSFQHAVVLVSRKGMGASQIAWGQTVRRHANTVRLNLDEDILNRKVILFIDCAINRLRYE
jgi:hypothetical protein